jgi:hypothetical protein
MSVLRDSPYSLSLGDSVQAKVRAYNERGWSSYSSSGSGATVQTIPGTMSAPTRGSATSETQIEVSWTALTSSTQTGGATILSYNLQWDAGTNQATWYNLIGSTTASTVTTLTVTSQVTAATTYNFRVRAKNIHGWGSYSSTTAIKAARKPYQMSTPTTSIDSSTGGVRISWVAPNNGQETITNYTIVIAASNGTYYTTSFCNGSSSTVISNLQCVVPMSNLITHFGLSFDTTV